MRSPTRFDEVSLSHIPQSVYGTTRNWMNLPPIEVKYFSVFIVRAFDQILLDLEAQQGGGDDSKSQVGMFVAIVLHCKPEALTSVLPTLREDSNVGRKGDGWDERQRFILYGEGNEKFFALDMLKQFIEVSASQIMLFRSPESSGVLMDLDDANFSGADDSIASFADDFLDSVPGAFTVLRVEI
ncbi:hypothetical protein Bca4012_066026 [Brassica carinata]